MKRRAARPRRIRRARGSHPQRACRPQLRAARADGGGGRPRDAARRTHRHAAVAERRQRRRHRPRRPEPERIRRALLAPGLRLPRGRRPRRGLARRPQAQSVRHGARLDLPPGTRRVLSRRPVGVRGGRRRPRAAGAGASAALLADNVAVGTPRHAAPTTWSPTRGRIATSSRTSGRSRRSPLAEEPAAATRERAQAWLRLHGYEPTTLRLSAFKRLGARVASANVAFDDHPNEKRFSDRIETVTVDSVFRWLQRDGLGGAVQVIR